MKIKQLQGCSVAKRAYNYDAGADVFFTDDIVLGARDFVVAEIDIAVDIPAGFVGWIVPRSSAANRGLFMANVPVDSGYKGKLHAFIFNASYDTIYVAKGKSIAQLVIQPVVLSEFNFSSYADCTSRGDKWAGSTGYNI